MGWLADLLGYTAERDLLKTEWRVRGQQAQAAGDDKTARIYRFWETMPDPEPYVDPEPCGTCRGEESIACPKNCDDGPFCDLCFGQGIIDCPACIGHEPAEGACPANCDDGDLPCACDGWEGCYLCGGSQVRVCDVCDGGRLY